MSAIVQELLQTCSTAAGNPETINTVDGIVDTVRHHLTNTPLGISS